MIITGSSKGRSQREPITDAIVAAVAEAKGVDVLALPPLWNVIDPEALEELFAPTDHDRRQRRGGRVVFGYCGYDVTVACDDSDDSIDVSIEPRSD